jgi:hypothetical protein
MLGRTIKNKELIFCLKCPYSLISSSKVTLFTIFIWLSAKHQAQKHFTGLAAAVVSWLQGNKMSFLSEH